MTSLIESSDHDRPVDTRRLQTLVVDDDPAIVRLIQAVLMQNLAESLDVVTTTEPGYVWNLASRAKVDICLTDMDMPEINGFQLLKQLKQLNPLTQVVFLTAQPTLSAARSAFAFGADDFLAKPVNLRDVCNCVQHLAFRLQRLERDLLP